MSRSPILRNNWYAENYAQDLATARETGAFVTSAGEGRVASAARADYAEAAAVVLTESGHEGQVYELAGDEAWTFDVLAAALAEVLGRDVELRQVSSEEHVAILEGVGLDAGTAGFVTGPGRQHPRRRAGLHGRHSVPAHRPAHHATRRRARPVGLTDSGCLASRARDSPAWPTAGPRQELLDLVLDEGSFESWDEPIDISDAPPDYRAALEAAREKAGTDESVLTGRGLVHGRPVAVVANEFRFLAGSIGLAAARRITSAVRRATAEGLPVLATTASGGTRMQEGTPAFVQMVEISRALMEHRAAGLPYLAYLRHPTTGGVYASWGSLAHVTVGEPGALIGFLGPKVFEALNGTPFPEGVQVAENLSNHGVIDGVATAEELPGLVDAVLAILVDPPSEPRLPRRSGELDPDRDAWASIQETRGEDRIGVRDVLRHGTEVLLPLSGTEKGERDSTVLVVMARLDGEPCLVVGQDRSRQGPGDRRWGRARCVRRGARCGSPTRCGCRWSP